MPIYTNNYASTAQLEISEYYRHLVSDPAPSYMSNVDITIYSQSIIITMIIYSKLMDITIDIFMARKELQIQAHEIKSLNHHLNRLMP